MASDAVAWLFGLEQFGIKLGLDHITAILDALDRPDRSYASAHVAGTNGKGSVTAMVAACLSAAGHRTGRYTSPHLVDIRERIAIDGSIVSRDLFAEVLRDVRTTVHHLLEVGRLRTQPTFFEVTTAIAFEVFRRVEVQVAVVEVGLGGRLDATNVLHPIVSAITSIGLDHERHLGSTLTAIAGEKAGILKPGVPVVLGRLPAEARRTVDAVAAAVGSPVIDATAVAVEGRGTTQRDGRVVQNVHLRTPTRDYGQISLGLLGTHQHDNAAVAVRMLEALDNRGVRVPPASIAEGLASVSWPGRLEWRRFPDGRELLLDAAHNPDGAQALAAYLRESGPPHPLVFAAMRDKNIAGTLAALLPVVSGVVVTRASNARAEEPAVIAAVAQELAPAQRVTVEPSPIRALALAWESAPTVVAAGSLFLLGDILEALGAP